MSNAHVFEFRSHGKPVRMHLSRAGDHLQRLIRERGRFYELGMLEDVCARLPEAACVVDVGANIGNHTVYFAHIVGASTIAIEPNPAALEILRRNIALNDLGERVELHAVAMGESDGQGAVRDDDPGNLGRARIEVGGSGLGVPVRRLDDIVGARHVDLIKIDVEGMEPMVLRGAKATLARCRPLLLVEAATAEQLAPIEAELRPLGYVKRHVYNDTPTYLFEHDNAATRTLEQVDAALLARLPATTEVVAGLATVAGNEQALRAAVMSLLPQVDRLHVWLNHHESVPAFLQRHAKIRTHLDPDGRRYGDAGKFWGVAQSPDAVYLSCDDDIVYPPDYAKRMVEALARIRGRGAVGVHGALVLQPSRGYYVDGARTVFHFEQALLRERRAHVLGTATCAIHTAVLPLTLDDFERPNMADIWLARRLQREGLPALVVSRPAKWLQAVEVQRPTIYEQSSRGAGDAYDSARPQDEILAGMWPLSLLGAREAAPCPVLLFSTEAADGVDELIAAFAARHRDAVAIVLDKSAGDAVRERAHQAALGCEIHVLRPDAGAALRAAYRSLVERAAGRSLSCGALRHVRGAMQGFEDLGAAAWKNLLA